MMNDLLNDLLGILASTALDVLPIAAIIVFFQAVILKQPVPRLKRVLIGGVYVILGLTLFLLGLEKALFPLGDLMARQLASPSFLEVAVGESPDWQAYYWFYLFAFLIGFSTTIAEPSLIAVALKAHEVSSGTISQWGLRITVALGVGLALSVGAFRIITGTPLYLYILAGYVVVVVQTLFAPKQLIALAYDSGGVTTSTVTVPIVAALGIGLSDAVPGSNPAVDGFGLIAFASLFPIISVLGYAQIRQYLDHKLKRRIQ